MRYAILKDGSPRYAPSSIALGDRRIFNPTPEQLLSAGYLPVVASEPPQTDADHYPESSWAEKDGQIVQVWTVKEIPVEQGGPTLESLDHRLSDVEYIITGEVATNAQ